MSPPRKTAPYRVTTTAGKQFVVYALSHDDAGELFELAMPDEAEDGYVVTADHDGDR